MKRNLWLLACLSALLAVGCGSDPSKPEVHNPKLPAGSTLAVIDFRDCTIPDQEDCVGSGKAGTAVFLNQLSSSTVFHVQPLDRPVDAKADLSDDAAVAYAKAKGYAYVMNGEITDYYKVSFIPGTWWRKERAAVTVRVFNVADGKMLYVHTDSDTAHQGSSPEEMLKSMASDVQDALEDN
ncbi:MAG TPA: hypothetical protein VGM16_07520 [Gammaproteobacteria bacterium]|jgi:hypothetical protein